MPVKATDFLESAKRELQNGEEVNFRNGISRAYYAAYHSCIPLDSILPNHGGIRTNVGVHEQFISKLTAHPTMRDGLAKNAGTKIKSLGYVLNQCRTARYKADYDLDATVTINEVEGQISLTEKVIEKVRELKSILSSDELSEELMDTSLISKL